MKKTSFLIFLLVFLLAFFKYFYNFQKRAFFEFDQEYLSMEAKKIIIDKDFTLIGAPTSVGGMFIAPFYNYFMALAHFVGGMNPYTVDFVSSLWGVANLVAIFLVGKKLFGLKVGLFSFIIALLSFQFLRTEGLPPLLFPLPFCSLLIFYLLTKKRINWFWLAALVGFSFHLHFSAVFFLPMIFFVLLWQKPKDFSIKKLFIPFLIILFFVSPLILFELRNQFFISKNFVVFLRQKGGDFNLFSQILKSLDISLRNLGNLVYHQPLSFSKIFLSSFFLLMTFFSGRKRKIVLLSLVWILLPILIFAFYKGHIINYYFVIQEPIFFLLIGLSLDFIFEKLVGKFLIVFSLCFLTFVSLRSSISWQSCHTLYYKMKAFDFIKEKTSKDPFYLSFTIEPAWRGGYDYLAFWYKFKLLDKPDLQHKTVTVIHPHNWHEIKSDYIFGDVGVGISQ